jgi:cyanophycinase
MIKFILLLTITSFINIHAQGYLCAVGGGSEDYNDWSDAPYGWTVQKADSGKIIIISDADASTWLPNYFLSLGALEAYNKKIDSRAVADLQSTYDELVTADGIFVRGGDQWDYINLWKGTKTEEAIVYVFQNGGVIAGTSAGAAVLGDLDFTARYGSAYPRSSLTNPMQVKLDFDDDFIDLQPNVIFDSHFIERGRFGRLIPMIYKIDRALGRDVIGIGIDDKTALCIKPDGIAEVMGTAAVSFFYQDELTNFTDFQNDLYTIENLKCDQLTKGWKFNLNTREIEYIPPSAKEVDTSRVWQYPKTIFTLTGSNDIANQLNNRFNDFICGINNPSIVIFSNQSFSSQVQQITDYLIQHSIENHLIFLSQSSLNNFDYEQAINGANAFIFAGDSLAALSLLNQTSELIPQAFYNKINLQTPCFFFGNCGKVTGEFYINNTDDENYAAYRGKLTNNEGIRLFEDLIFQPLVFDDDNYFENRSCSVLWGLMLDRKRVGIYLDGYTTLEINSETNSLTGTGSIPWIIVDARQTTYVDSSTYVASSGVAPRQVVAMNNLRYSLTKYSGINYLLEEGKFDNLVEVESRINEIPNQFELKQNYPNPFNPGTNIEFTLSESQKISIQVFDTLGREIRTIANEFYPAGNHKIIFSGSGLSSGVYFYKLTANKYTQTKAMILLK